ncbi:hypothetical protein ElyMa_006621600 [Elysia marginata]|uniref:Uncharacterized protein n=1 Tax=Elysia marginata TaxID=1093978 RepID=A0AAV4IJI9_9GAST|nr:hypothetical protein ElyMa_006621600 [Elysia marginata]
MTLRRPFLTSQKMMMVWPRFHLLKLYPDLDEVPATSTSDFQDEDPASPASRFPDDELIYPAEAPSYEVDHEDDGQAAGGRSLTDGKFLGVLELIDTLTVSTKGLPSIPVGRKENTLFIIQNQRNIDRRAVGQGCSFTDDCGTWKPSPSPGTRMIKNGERWQSIILRGGQYGTEKQVNGKKMFVPADQQPTPHGNAKTTREPYTRTDPSVLNAIKKASNTIKPREIYEQLKRKPTEDEGPKNLRQVQNTKYHTHKRRRVEEGKQNQGGNNLGDNINQLHNAIHDHPFIQEIFHRKQHVPGIVLLTTQQIRDIRRFCCSSPPGEGTVLGVDKTFNLGQLHVTPTVFKHLGIVRPTTNTHPIFIGPTLIHGNSDRKTYSIFFNFIKQELEDAPKDPVIGSDEEMAIRQLAVWCTKTDEQRRRHMENFERALKIMRSMATSSDGDIYVLTFGARGKKIGQKKRVKASRTGRL